MNYCLVLLCAMNHVKKCLFFSLLLLTTFFVRQTHCLNFNYTSFNNLNERDFILTNSEIAFNAVQVTPEAHGADIRNLAGRTLYRQPLNLWNKKRNITASFNSTFIMRITPQSDPYGEGLAFILTGNNGIPIDSHGQWLGITNMTLNGSSSNNIVAVEFDTRQSYDEDLDGNHVGIDVNSVFSMPQAPVGVNFSSGTDVVASVRYDGRSRIMSVFVGENSDNPIISKKIDLSSVLPEHVHVGFSGSTGEYTERNCIRGWNFTSTEIDDDEDGYDLLWVWILISIVCIVLGIGFLVYFYLKKMKIKQQEIQSNSNLEFEIQIQGSSTAPQRFKLDELKNGTDNFDPKNILGRGGCGVVYKAILGSGEAAAVKRFRKNSSERKQDFVAEITTIGNLHHKNLVRLIGLCYEGDELLVVYEFMPNGSLEKILSRGRLTWVRRCGIISGVAAAVDYLHNGCEKRVLHRDVKASNVMLDSEFNPRLGDFGLARMIQEAGQTHHSTKKIAGTPGYMAPESFHMGRATVETDVYAFGVLTLEIVTGRKPKSQNDGDGNSNGITDWVWDLHATGRLIEAVDLQLGEKYEEEEAACLLWLGLACCHPNPYQRPSIRTALQVITGEVAAPPSIPIEKPVFTWPAAAPSFTENLDCSITGGQITQISKSE